ncbi:MAG: hypothetical protein HY744_16935 [Deltaproteobacteria bacterium]|nr:hypothetical protein [Deltaproteobacteria bacterium]
MAFFRFPLLRPGALAGAALLWLAGCGAASPQAEAPAGPGDLPVPSGEPRRTLRLRIDLPPRHDCEEAFDLALYATRAVELVQWDRGRRSCADRAVAIRFLVRRLGEEALLARVRELAAAVRLDGPPSRGSP